MKPKKSDFESILIYCDGACSGNPGKGGWGVIIVTPDGKVKELGGGADLTTNNQMELTAVIKALKAISNIPGPVTVLTDSSYVIRGITQWIWGWRRKGWKNAEGNDVANRDYWEALAEQVQKREKDSISWKFVKGHSGNPGNDRVDEIAVAFTQEKWVDLYNGSLLKYSVAVHDIPENTEVPEMKPKKEKGPAAHSYLSLLDGIPMRHKTWAECEWRVKGRSGAKFKKAMTASDENKILDGWGIEPSKLK